MRTLFFDTSALVRCYFEDEADHDLLQSQLRDGPDAVVISELTIVEMASAVYAAGRASRCDAEALEAVFRADLGTGGPIATIRFIPEALFDEARRLLSTHPLHTLDALQLASVLVQAVPMARDLGSEVTLVTRDERQAQAVEKERPPGLTVASS